MSDDEFKRWRVDVGDDYVYVESTHISVDERGVLHLFNRVVRNNTSFSYDTVAMFANGSWRNFTLVEDDDADG